MALVNHCRLTPVVRGGWVRAVSSHALVPGDVVVVQRGKAMCDMVILQGACLVIESMLSGEVDLLHLGHLCTGFVHMTKPVQASYRGVDI